MFTPSKFQSIYLVCVENVSTFYLHIDILILIIDMFFLDKRHTHGYIQDLNHGGGGKKGYMP